MSTTTVQTHDGDDPDRAIDLTTIEAELIPLTTNKIKALFLECYCKTAEFMARAAVCVKIMEDRGENIKGFPMLGVFRRIACGQVLPEVAWAYVESPGRTIIERCALPDQKRLVENPRVRVIEPTPDGKGYTPRLVDMRTAHASIVRQAIGPEGIRTDEEQIVYIRTQQSRLANTIADAKAKGIGVPQEPFAGDIRVRFTESELEAIRIRAIRNKTEPWVIIRRFLAETDAFKLPKT